VWFERTLRLVAMIALACAAWPLWRGPHVTDGETLAPVPLPADSTLAAWLAEPSRTALALTLAEVPAQPVRALLQAGRQAGVGVTWSEPPAGTLLPALAVSAEARPTPTGGRVVRAALAGEHTLTLADALGWLDSVRMQQGTTWRVPGDAASFTVQAGDTRAIARVLTGAVVRRVRLYGTPGWETRFTTRALEEAGWLVDASLPLAPRVAMQVGAPSPPDTARYGAVLALDSVAWRDASAIARFVREGGGLLLAPAAADGAPAALPTVGGVGPLVSGIPGAVRTARPLDGLPFRAVRPLREDAVVLARRTVTPDRAVALAARRVGAGRVLQLGWTDTWEWRQLGDDSAVVAHRVWWDDLLARVVRRPVDARDQDTGGPLPGDAAPLADLVARIGPADGEPPFEPAPAQPARPDARWAALALALLVFEWWARRLRGAA
jgi:hypothetical protein